MARWKLMAPHYLNLTDKTEWEYMEVSNGKHRRHRFVVPRVLDPRDPGDWNSRWGQDSTNAMVGNADGEIVVCLPGKGAPNDFEFLGEPTPDMMPLDDEAQAISASYSEKWNYRPDNADSSFSQSLVDGFREAMEDRTPQTVQIEGFNDLMAMLARSQQATAEALTHLASPSRRA